MLDQTKVKLYYRSRRNNRL